MAEASVVIDGRDFYAPRRCFREPIAEVFEAAALLDRAADAHLEGNAMLAEELIRRADIPTLFAWTDSIWGRHDQDLHRVRELPAAPPTMPVHARLQPRMPTAATRRALVERDGHHCRFCGIPVISREVRSMLRLAYPLALRWGRTNSEQHRAFQCMWRQYDHILPHGRGGDSSIQNMVVTCAPCNFGRVDYTLEEVGLMDPRQTAVQSSSWDGLERLFGSTALRVAAQSTAR